MQLNHPTWPPPPLDSLPRLDDAADKWGADKWGAGPDRMTRLLQARAEWLIADAIGLPTALDYPSRKPRRRRGLRTLRRWLTRRVSGPRF